MSTSSICVKLDPLTKRKFQLAATFFGVTQAQLITTLLDNLTGSYPRFWEFLQADHQYTVLEAQKEAENAQRE